MALSLMLGDGHNSEKRHTKATGGSRKRKADVLIILQDPDQELEPQMAQRTKELAAFICELQKHGSRNGYRASKTRQPCLPGNADVRTQPPACDTQLPDPSKADFVYHPLPQTLKRNVIPRSGELYCVDLPDAAQPLHKNVPAGIFHVCCSPGPFLWLGLYFSLNDWGRQERGSNREGEGGRQERGSSHGDEGGRQERGSTHWDEGIARSVVPTMGMKGVARSGVPTMGMKGVARSVVPTMGMKGVAGSVVPTMGMKGVAGSGVPTMGMKGGAWRSESVCDSLYRFIPTPEKEDKAPEPTSCPPHPSLKFRPTTVSPLPQLSWANQDDVWRNMLHKDRTYPRDKNLFRRHPELQLSMRAILIDWLMEVCEVYKLHRETFYLAQDFFDRFMATQENVVKSGLQLIGITSLFIAAKLEEIYPPKLHQFAYITDSACTEDEMISMELIIMKALKWRLSPMTMVSWLNIYLQVAYIRELQHFLLPQYPQETYIQIVELLDLCILDIGCLEYPYSVLAASALYHFSNAELVEKVSGYEWTELEDCIKYIVPFAMAVRDAGKQSKLKFFRGVDIEDLHNIQTHTGCLQLLEKAQTKREQLKQESQIAPVPSGVLTPPQSDKKVRTPDSE
ncbi:PREDICTED: G1/S-specific cyclin-E1 [Nanorana parkeri]|uniref:G1/S-specific cyclin-E1 n=1 Tax=Nanorana parkeri TaxID=125878 RepID=UPI000854B739|nr:PREDICTED: G1/S-specific cyclin-E1 [Nanorana parkeri]